MLLRARRTCCHFHSKRSNKDRLHKPRPLAPKFSHECQPIPANPPNSIACSCRQHLPPSQRAPLAYFCSDHPCASQAPPKPRLLLQMPTRKFSQHDAEENQGPSSRLDRIPKSTICTLERLANYMSCCCSDS